MSLSSFRTLKEARLLHKIQSMPPIKRVSITENKEKILKVGDTTNSKYSKLLDEWNFFKKDFQLNSFAKRFKYFSKEIIIQAYLMNQKKITYLNFIKLMF